MAVFIFENNFPQFYSRSISVASTVSNEINLEPRNHEVFRTVKSWCMNVTIK